MGQLPQPAMPFAAIAGEPGGPAQKLESASDAQAEAAPRLSGGEIRTLRKTAESAERKIGTLQGKQEDLRRQMQEADPSDYVALGDFQAKIAQLQDEIDELEMQWLEALERLGE